ncbi:MAG: SAF domain-containing protein [Actinomycetota bacterium]|nr:SAF domain-containing protein [Actinomycetota bacterium]
MADSRKSPGSRASGGSTSTRLPSSRERRPALAALAVLLIVGGAFASGWLALQAGNRAEYLAVRDGAEIGPGELIAEGDLESVELPEDFEGAISVARLEDLADLRAVTRLVSGTVLLETMLSPEGSLTDGQQELGLTVEDSPLVSSLESGSLVAINVVPQDDEGKTMTYVVTLSSPHVPPGDEGGIGSGADDVAQLSIAVSAECIAPLAEAIDAEAVVVGRVDQVPQNVAVDCTGSGDDGPSSETS